MRVGQEIERDRLLTELVNIQFDRNDIDFQRGRFRVRGDVVEIFPASRDERALRVEFFGDEIDRIREVDALTGEVIGDRDHVSIFPATHFMTNEEVMDRTLPQIEADMKKQVKSLLMRESFLKQSGFSNGQLMILK